MKRVHILGRKNHGKTTLVVELVEYLTARGMHVGTIKHTHHAHELDTPGKDSHRHGEAGASVASCEANWAIVMLWHTAEESRLFASLATTRRQPGTRRSPSADTSAG